MHFAGRLIVLAAFATTAVCASGETVQITRWLRDGVTTNSAEKTLFDAREVEFSPMGSAGWAPLPNPLSLPVGASATLSMRMTLAQPLGTNSPGQIRIGIFGLPGGSTARFVRDTSELRGFITACGNVRDEFQLGSWLRDGNSGATMTMRATRPVNEVRSSGTGGGAGVVFRVVTTIKRTGKQGYECSGFFGDRAFAFAPVEAPFELDDIAAVGFLNGGASGVAKVQLSDVRLTITAP